MPAKRIIPCLDVTDGRVVKGVKFKNLRDAGDPAELAATYDREGADEIVFLDITASSDARDTTVHMVERVAEQVFIPFTVGGGIRTVDDVRAMLRAGADKVSLNTAVVADPELVRRASDEFGAQCIVVAIDARRRTHAAPSSGMPPPADSAGPSATQAWDVVTHGGRTPTGLEAVEWAAEVCRLGAGEILLTSMDRDGTHAGYDLDLLRAVGDAVPVPVIASGGVGTLEHLYEAVHEGGADAVLAASIFHFATFRIREAKDYLAERGVTIRP